MKKECEHGNGTSLESMISFANQFFFVKEFLSI